MQQYKKILGKVMMTAEGTYDSTKEYDPISLITDEETGKSYISRKEVPAGTQINNREYWQPVASSGIIDNGVIILNRKNSDGQVPIYDLKSAAEAVAAGDRKGGVILGFLGFNPETDTVPTWKLYQYNDVSPSNWTNIDYWLPMDYTNKYAGWFDNEEALYDSVPFPKVGMYAYVGNSASSAVVYRCYNDRVWQPTEDKAFTGVVNLADEEDITSKQNKLKFKDKEYNPAQFSGLGKLYLRKNVVDGVNILTQAMMQATNTIYIIQYDYDLQGETITVPENCTLQFEGGSFSNGTIEGNNTVFNNTPKFKSILFNGTFNNNIIYVDWFGTKGDGEIDDSGAIQSALDFARLNYSCNVLFKKDKYYIHYPIFILGKNITLDGENRVIIIATQNGSGRGGLNIGQSYEFNKDSTDYSRNNGTLGSTNVNYKNNPTLADNIEDIFYKNSNRNEAENCWIKNITVEFDYTRPNSWGWGGYAFNISNSYNCHIRNCISYGACQMLSIGSDVAPETPGNNYCSAENCIAYKPGRDPYYTIGFISNSVNCWIKNCISTDHIELKLDGNKSDNGNGLAIAYSKNCHISDIAISLGKNSVVGEAILVNHCNNIIIENITIDNANTGFATTSLNNDKTYGMIYVNNIIIKNCNIGIVLQWKHCYINNVNVYDCTKQLVFSNVNAQYNYINNSNITAFTNPFSSLYELYNNGNIIKNNHINKIYYLLPSVYAANSMRNDYYQHPNNNNVTIKIPLHINNITEIKTQILFPMASTSDSSITINLKRAIKISNNVGDIGIQTKTYVIKPTNVGADHDVNVDVYPTDILDINSNIEYESWLEINISNCPQYTQIKGISLYYKDLN